MNSPPHPGTQSGCVPIDDSAHARLTAMIDELGEGVTRRALGIPRETLVRALARRPLRVATRIQLQIALETTRSRKSA